MIEFISQAWPWYVSGPMLALVMILLLWAGGQLGVSATLRTICSAVGAGHKVKFFDYNWKNSMWNIAFVFGVIIGGFFAGNYLVNTEPLQLASSTINDLNSLGLSFDGGLAPESIFSWEYFMTLKGALIFIGGGILVGFGTRWAGGCTSGHAISGLSNLQLPSLIAVSGFFIGGLVMTHFLFPLIF